MHSLAPRAGTNQDHCSLCQLLITGVPGTTRARCGRGLMRHGRGLGGACLAHPPSAPLQNCHSPAANQHLARATACHAVSSVPRAEQFTPLSQCPSALKKEDPSISTGPPGPSIAQSGQRGKSEPSGSAGSRDTRIHLGRHRGSKSQVPARRNLV